MQMQLQRNFFSILLLFLLLGILSGCTNNKKPIDPREEEVFRLVNYHKYNEARNKANELFVNDEKQLKEIIKEINESEEVNAKLDKQMADLVDKIKQDRAASSSSTSLSTSLQIQPGYEGNVKDGYIYVTGSVKNVGNTPISYFEVVVKFKDDNGQVQDSDYTNDGLKLNPGEIRQFEIMHKWNERYKKFNLSIGEVKLMVKL